MVDVHHLCYFSENNNKGIAVSNITDRHIYTKFQLPDGNNGMPDAMLERMDALAMLIRNYRGFKYDGKAIVDATIALRKMWVNVSTYRIGVTCGLELIKYINDSTRVCHCPSYTNSFVKDALAILDTELKTPITSISRYFIYYTRGFNTPVTLAPYKRCNINPRGLALATEENELITLYRNTKSVRDVAIIILLLSDILVTSVE